MVDKKTDDREAFGFKKKLYNHYFDKQSGNMKNTQFKADDVFCDRKRKDSFSPEQITELKFFQPKYC